MMFLLRRVALGLLCSSASIALGKIVHVPRQASTTTSSTTAVAPATEEPAPSTDTIVTLAGEIVATIEDAALIIGLSTIPPGGATTIGITGRALHTVSLDVLSNVIVDGSTTPMASLLDAPAVTTSANAPTQTSVTGPGLSQPDSTTSIGGSSSVNITVPPATTTVPPEVFTSSASSASDKIIALVPIVTAWMTSPGGDTGPVLSSIDTLQGELEGLIASSGTSTGRCTPKRVKRALQKRDIIEDIVEGLTCAVEDLAKIGDSITGGDVTVVQEALNGLTGVANTVGGNPSEDDDDDDDNNNQNTTSEHNTETSSSSECSKATAMLVTSDCVVSTVTSGGSSSMVTTCTSSTTVETTGCSVTDTTTSLLTTSSGSLPAPCAMTNCKDACNTEQQPFTVSLSPDQTASDCSFATTVTTDVLPIASDWSGDNPRTDAPGSSVNAKTKRNDSFASENQTDTSSSPKTSIRMIGLEDPLQYLEEVEPEWLNHQAGQITGAYFAYNLESTDAVGVRGLYGCMSIFILANAGAFVSHLYEEYVLNQGNWVESNDATWQRAIQDLLDGTSTSVGIRSLIGTDEFPGPLHHTLNPVVVVVTPFTSNYDRGILGIRTQYHYQAKSGEIAERLSVELTGSDDAAFIRGYERTNAETAEKEGGWQGRAIVVWDPYDQWFLNERDPNGPGLQIGKYQLVVADRIVFEGLAPVGSPDALSNQGLLRRDLDPMPNPCAPGDDVSSATAAISSVATAISSFVTSTLAATTLNPDFPTLSEIQCATSSCVDGQWIYSYLPTNSPCPTGTITTGCHIQTTEASSISSAPTEPSPSSLTCGTLAPNNNVDPFTAGVGVPVCFADDMVSIFCSASFAGDKPTIGGHIQPHTSIFRFKYQSQAPNAATDGLYISLQNVDIDGCIPPIFEGEEGDEIDQQCVDNLMGIIHNCDTSTGSEKHGGTRYVDCQAWSIFPFNMESGFDDDPDVWSGDPNIINECWDYCSDPDHYLQTGPRDD